MTTSKKAKWGLRALLRELSDDEVDGTETGTETLDDSDHPWSRYFQAYMDAPKQVPDGWSAIQWWGVSVPTWCSGAQYSNNYILFQVNSSRYHPTWGSLARDHLSIMSSSVSSERAFSQGGITISKWRNRLKGDIVEMLQCVKCAI